MRQTICDRCGKILPSYRDVTKLIISNYVSIQDTSYDLCKECAKEMNNLIKGETKKSREKRGYALKQNIAPQKINLFLTRFIISQRY